MKRSGEHSYKVGALHKSPESLNPSSRPSNIANIVSSKVADDAVLNVQDAVSIGTEAMKEHGRQWPEGFRNTISKKVKTIADGKNILSVGTERVCLITRL